MKLDALGHTGDAARKAHIPSFPQVLSTGFTSLLFPKISQVEVTFYVAQGDQ